MSKIGALPDSLIKEMLDSKQITGADKELINPSSLDLQITEDIYRVNGMVLPRPGEKIEDILSQINATEHDIKNPLESGVHYLIKNKAGFELPDSVFGFCNPKSTSGRTNVHSRVIAYKNIMFDSIQPRGFKGSTWTHIIPSSFPIILEPDMSFSQVRLFNRDTRLNQTEVEIVNKKDPILYSSDGKIIDLKDKLEGGGSISLSINCSQGWECLGEQNILDLSRRDQKPEDFFRLIENKNGSIKLRRGCFYIFYTSEYVCIPPHLACEMRPMDPRYGEYRSHYAGFIDPGWGYGPKGKGRGRPIVLEIIPFEDTWVRPGQIIARIKLERVMQNPDLHYDELDKSNYKVHGVLPKLSKHFDMSQFKTN